MEVPTLLSHPGKQDSFMLGLCSCHDYPLEMRLILTQNLVLISRLLMLYTHITHTFFFLSHITRLFGESTTGSQQVINVLREQRVVIGTGFSSS